MTPFVGRCPKIIPQALEIRPSKEPGAISGDHLMLSGRRDLGLALGRSVALQMWPGGVIARPTRPPARARKMTKMAGAITKT